MTHTIDFVGDRVHRAILEHAPAGGPRDGDIAATLFDLTVTVREVVGGALTEVVDNERDEIMPTDPQWFSGSSFDMTATIGQFRRVVDATVAAAALMRLRFHNEAWHLLSAAGQHAMELSAMADTPGWARMHAGFSVSATTGLAAAAHELGYRINGPDADLELALQGATRPSHIELVVDPRAVGGALTLIGLGNEDAMLRLRPTDLDPRHSGHTSPDDSDRVLWRATTDLLVGAAAIVQSVMGTLCPDDVSWEDLEDGVRAAVDHLTDRATPDAA